MFSIFKQNFNKEGSGIFPEEPQMGFALMWSRYLASFWKLFTLNWLFWISCIPIVTIPASISGFIYVSRLCCDQALVYTGNDFFAGFRQNFWRSTVAGVLWLIVVALSYLFFTLSNLASGWWVFALEALYSIGCATWLMMQFYVFHMIVSTPLPLLTIYHNALHLTLAYFFKNLLLLLCTVVFLALGVWFFPYSLVLVVLVGYFTFGFCTTFFIWNIIKKHVISADDTELT